jgi:very-short-patch-repair endonuclease
MWQGAVAAPESSTVARPSASAAMVLLRWLRALGQIAGLTGARSPRPCPDFAREGVREDASERHAWSTVAAMDERKDMLVGVLPRKRDLETLVRDRWYRIPTDIRLPTGWPPKWVAFYEGKPIRPDIGIYRYARVEGIEERDREELFPGELAGSRRGRKYHVLRLGPIQERAEPVRFLRPRRFAFISTSMRRFEAAETVNDLYADSPLEDRLWSAFKEWDIPAERQWEHLAGGNRYYLDFALFCRDGKIDVEADGDTYHITRKKAPLDNERNNELAEYGWKVLRFDTNDIQNRLRNCVDRVLGTVERLKGFKTPKLMPDRYIRTPSGVVSQLSLFEERAEYDAGRTQTGDA